MFGQKNNQKKQPASKIFSQLFSIGSRFIACSTRLFKNCNKFIKGEKKEVTELATGQEDFKRFRRDSWLLIKDFFIPYQGNDHKPKALRPKSLIAYVLVIILVKVVTTGFLFFIYPSPAQLSAIVSGQMVELINEARADNGAEPLIINSDLSVAALKKGQDMLAKQYFAHDTPEGKKPWDWIDRSKYDYIYAGENLAMDFTSAEVVQSAFMKSPTHRKNILNSKYREVGIAVLNGEMNGHQTILLVEFFGTQRLAVATELANNKPATEVKSIPSTPKPTPNIPVAVNSGQTKGAEVVKSATPATNNSAIADPDNLTDEILPQGIIMVNTDQKNSGILTDEIIKYSNLFFMAFLVFILASLMLNIFIKIRVQHSSLILQTVVVIALISAVLLTKFHFLEQVPSQLLIV